MFFLRDGEDIKLADSQYKTFNNTKDMGFDIQLNKQIGNNWNTYIGYSYLHHKSDYSAQTDRVKLGYLPKHALNIGVTYAENKFDAGLNVRAVLDIEMVKILILEIQAINILKANIIGL